jgi:hypothetical protein
MLNKLLSVLGIQALLDQAKRRVESLVRNAEDKIKFEAKTYGIIAALALAGAAMAFLTLVVVLIAIFNLVDRAWGENVALLTVVLIPAITTATLAALTVKRLNDAQRPVNASALENPVSSSYSNEQMSVEPRVPPPAIKIPYRDFSAEPSELRAMLSGALGDFFGSAPTTGTRVDRVIQKFTHEAAAASEKTVEFGVEVVSRGSRKAAFGVLVGTAFLGWFLTRKSGAGTTA